MNNKNDTFTFDEAVKSYTSEKIRICKNNNDCINEEFCNKGNCMVQLSCSQDKTKCIESYYNNNHITNSTCTINEDCISNSCINNRCVGNLLICNIEPSKGICGLDNYSKCIVNSECLSGICKNDLCIPKSTNIAVPPGLICLAAVLLFIIISILTCLCCGCCKKTKHETK
ncbi:hypothetical protein BCR32DRAFT_292028 [Anaeromyces robustus]|uniref:Uncharacterized protein n=1 Tax=Anaeromyces robustus TaxID=1754192 RepID=A0A1Y1XC50_9FUNG|nr:hypothetical protein BCR32DRAFT_292028 [Anaeromyces robustus]|eukprot:ORX83351.1 hypothetical protein BCR32DRAFT_292028 [Anaeromyces robustus]